MQRLHRQMLIRSPHWGSLIQLGADGFVTETLVGRHPNAQIAEPLSATLNTKFDDDTADIRDEYLHSLRFGVARKIVIPGK
jgi:hypothetical protein